MCKKSRHTIICLVFVTACLPGCGRDLPETATVNGRITYGGKPVPCGRVCFWPKKGRPAIGEISPDGTYALSSFGHGDGAIISDDFRVSIQSSRVRNADGAKPSDGGITGNEYLERIIPRHYERPETSGLTASVHAGENIINFDLPAESNPAL